MIQFFRKYTRQLAFSLMVIIINLSIDAPDPVRFMDDKIVSAEDLSVNEIESIAEWFLEDVCNIPNAIPESDDNDATAPIVKHFVDYYFINTHFLTTVMPDFVSVSYKMVHFFAQSFWRCDHIFILIKPPRQ